MNFINKKITKEINRYQMKNDYFNKIIKFINIYYFKIEK